MDPSPFKVPVGVGAGNQTSEAGRGLMPLASVLDAFLPREAAPPQDVPLQDAVGQVLAAPLVAPSSIPARPIALRRGYAMRAADLVGASPYSPVWLSVGPALLAIGDALPAGSDTLLPIEALERRGGGVEVSQSVPPGHDVRRAGEDAGAGLIVCAAGRVLSEFAMACAMAAGATRASVRPVRVRLISAQAGPEVVLIAACASRSGAAVEHAHDLESTEAVARSGADLVVVFSGPAPPFLEHSDHLVATAVAVRPGDGLTCGAIGGAPFVVVPSRIDAALAACLLLIQPWLDRFSGATERTPNLSGPLTRKVSSSLGLAELALVKRVADGLEPIATGDLTLATIAAADGWMTVPPESEGYAAGTPVRASLMRDCFG